MLKFRTNTKEDICLDVTTLLEKVAFDDLELDSTALLICLNSSNTNLIGALLPDASLNLVIEPTNRKIHIEKISESKEEEIQIKHLAIHMTDEDKKMLLDFEEDFYNYRKVMEV